jgi:hypothetical protein
MSYLQTTKEEGEKKLEYPSKEFPPPHNMILRISKNTISIPRRRRCEEEKTTSAHMSKLHDSLSLSLALSLSGFEFSAVNSNACFMIPEVERILGIKNSWELGLVFC